MPFAGMGGPGRATHAPRGARGGGREGTQSNAGQKKPNKASERGPAQMGGLAQGAHRPGPPCNAGAPSQHPPGGVGGRNWGAGPGSGRGRPRGRAAADFFFGGRAWPRAQCCRHPLARSPALTVVRASPDLQQLGPRPRRAERAGRHPRGRAKQVERQVAGPGGGDSRGAGRARREEIFGAHERRHKGRRRGAGHWEMRGVGWGVCTRAWNGRGARGKGPTPLRPGRPRATRPNPKAAGPAREQASGVRGRRGERRKTSLLFLSLSPGAVHSSWSRQRPTVHGPPSDPPPDPLATQHQQ